MFWCIGEESRYAWWRYCSQIWEGEGWTHSWWKWHWTCFSIMCPNKPGISFLFIRQLNCIWFWSPFHVCFSYLHSKVLCVFFIYLQKCHVKNKDIRKFLDGIYVSDKAKIEEENWVFKVPGHLPFQSGCSFLKKYWNFSVWIFLFNHYTLFFFSGLV